MEVLITLDRVDGRLGAQIENGLRLLIKRGVLTPGARVPSSRALAEQLSVSRGLVLKAYDQLTAEGYLVSRRGSGTSVSLSGRPSRAAHNEADVFTAVRARYRHDFRPGVPDVRLFPINTWLRCLRRNLARNPSAVQYPSAAGWADTREALAGYLNRSRATDISASSVLMCTGFAQAVRVVSAALKAHGIRRIGVEDPSYIVRSGVLRDAGVELVPIPLDDEGLRVDVLARRRLDAVLVTPAHQYPTGVTLSGARRTALLNWVSGGSRFILEDDYDSEYRYDRSPVGSLQGLMPERVVYMGTASKMLAPGLRLAWMALPPALVATATRIKRHADGGSPMLDQLALQEFIVTGELDKHIRRTRLEYRARRDVLIGALERLLPSAAIEGASAGLHLLLPLHSGMSEDEVVDACALRGTRVCGARRHYAHPAAAPPGLVIGYGHVDGSVIESGVTTIARALHQH